MKDTQLRYEETLIKIDQKINNLAEAKGMTYDGFCDWSKRETLRQEISNDEVLLLTAYQLDQAIENIKPLGQRKELDESLWWRKRFYDEFGKVDKAMKHLTDVCGYIKDRYGYNYPHEDLLTLDEATYETLTDILKNKKKSGKGSLKYND